MAIVDPKSAKDKGIQGYLKLSITVLGPGTSPVCMHVCVYECRSPLVVFEKPVRSLLISLIEVHFHFSFSVVGAADCLHVELLLLCHPRWPVFDLAVR